jgi:peptidoglycan hydrolase-like protein with peptidoglycan-binding domain
MALSIPRLAVNTQIQAAAVNQPPLKVGSSGEGVVILQQALVDLGFTMPRSTRGGNSLPDGIFGAETEQVVKQFQTGNGLTADGVVGRLTLERLEAALIADSDNRQAQTAAAMTATRPVG